MSSMARSGRLRPTGMVGTAVAFLAAMVVLQACSAPGGGATPDDAEPGAVSTDLGSAPVTLRMHVNADQRDYMAELAAAFKQEHPTVTIEITAEPPEVLQQNVPRILAAENKNPPDLLRLPTMGDAAKNRLVLNLDRYAELYKWGEIPASQFTQLRVSSDGREKGTGSLYGVGLGFGVVGLYYNKKIAQELGFTQPPATLADLEAMLAKAKSSGKTAMIGAGNSSFLFQLLWLAHAGPQPISEWTLGAPDATIDSPEAVRAAETVRRWAQKGYFPADHLAIDETAAVGRFAKGEALAYVNGNWFAAMLDKQLPGQVGFIPFPLVAMDGRRTAMSAPLTYAIPARSTHHDAAAAFLNWALTSSQARRITIKSAGIVPGGVADQPAAEVAPGTALYDTLTAFQQISRSDGLVAFLGDASEGILAGTLAPQTQLLVSGRVSPEDYVRKIQADYQRDLGR